MSDFSHSRKDVHPSSH